MKKVKSRSMKMRHTKKWGTVNSEAELHMLAHAERTRKELERERKVIQRRLPKTHGGSKKPLY